MAKFRTIICSPKLFSTERIVECGVAACYRCKTRGTRSSWQHKDGSAYGYHRAGGVLSASEFRITVREYVA